MVATGLRQRQHVQVRRHRCGQLRGTGQRHRHRRKPDQQQVDREQPACRPQVRGLAQFDHADMELVRQGKRGDRPQRDHGQIVRHDGRWRQLRHLFQQRRTRLAHRQRRIEANGEQRHQLQHRLQPQCDHDATIGLGGRCLACTEQQGERGHRQREPERHVQLRGSRRETIAQQRAQALTDSLQLQGDVGNDAEQCHQGDGEAEAAIGTQSCDDQISDGGTVVLLGQPPQAEQEGQAERKDQRHAGQGGWNREAPLQSLRGRAVVGPRGAVHGQRQRIDERPCLRKPVPPALTPQRHAKQQCGPCNAGEEDDGGRQHRSSVGREPGRVVLGSDHDQ